MGTASFIDDLRLLEPAVDFALPGDDTFSSLYFSRPQAEMQPACVVRPRSAPDVQAAVRLALRHGVPFAVKSGGYMAWRGASNIGPEGITIDLGGLKTLELHDDDTVSLGPGLRWGEVYAFLGPRGRITMGARVTAVGVGGFLLGGGISLLTPERGLASSQITAYDVVLASGALVTASATSHPELFWALKFGSTNFGVVAQFRMRTFAHAGHRAWGGSLMYPIAEGNAQPVATTFEALRDFALEIESEPRRLFAPVVTWHPPAASYVVWIPYMHYGSLAPSSPFSPEQQRMLGPPLLDTLREDDISSFLAEWSTSPALSPSRNVWYSLTVRTHPEFVAEVFRKGCEVFGHLVHPNDGEGRGDETASWAFMTQPITRGMQRKSGDHPLRMVDPDGDEDFFLLAFFNVWQDPSYDAPMARAAAALYEWARDTAKARGLLADFVYSNYASGDQVPGVFEALADRERLLKARDAYDPQGMFRQLWRGGFKLPPS